MISLKIHNLKLNFLNHNLTIKCPVPSLNLLQNFKPTCLAIIKLKNRVKDQEQIFIQRKTFLQKEFVRNITKGNNKKIIQDNPRRQIKGKIRQ